jgi:quinol monooxygenase YgiN
MTTPTETVSFIVYLPTRPEARGKMREMLSEVLGRMSQEPDFVHTWAHEDAGDPDLIVIYETWACSREDFIEHHLKKPYRQAYEKALPDMLSGERRIVFLKTIGAYPGQR